MANLRAEVERLNAENAKFKSGELVALPLHEQVADAFVTSLQKKMDEHVKGIYSRIDKNHEICMTKLDSLEQTLAQVVEHLKISKSTTQSTPEDPSTKGEKDEEDKDENSSVVDEEIRCDEPVTAEAGATQSDCQTPLSDHGQIPQSPMKIPEDAIVHDTAPENYRSDVVDETDKVAVEALQTLAQTGEEPIKSQSEDKGKSAQDNVEKVADPVPADEKANSDPEDDTSSDTDKDDNAEIPLTQQKWESTSQFNDLTNDNSNADADGSDKGGDKGGEGASEKDSSTADREHDKSKGKMPESESIFTNMDYDNIPEDVNDDDAFDAAYYEAEEEGRFDESYLFTEDESVDPEHLKRVRKFKADHEASKAKLQELQNLVDEKRIIDNLIKVEKQKLWDAKCKEKREDISRKIGESWDIARQIFSGPQREPFEDGKFKSFV
ncbi:uncharacterized protein LOC135152482 [Daucus carota subsp. sativus]|uniref:uncharacterized protein LOC135152482 n=1 Tax=Daucus carota subsp. sativus TaxID=79200 RepID=UPI0030828F0C